MRGGVGHNIPNIAGLDSIIRREPPSLSHNGVHYKRPFAVPFCCTETPRRKVGRIGFPRHVALRLPDYEAFAGGFHHSFSHLFSGVDFQNPLDLSQ